MPVCFKCGKELATDQSLQYHLQKRVKCNTLYCGCCKTQFPNKLLFDNHKHGCNEMYVTSISNKDNDSNIRYEIFDTLMNLKNLKIVEVDKDKNIKYKSKNFDIDSTILTKAQYEDIKINSNTYTMTTKQVNTNRLFLFEKVLSH